MGLVWSMEPSAAQSPDSPADFLAPTQLAVIGASKGGEAALLIGATFPEVGAVVSVVGSGVITQGIRQDVLAGSFLDILGTPVASWTYQGRELPYLPNVVTPELEDAVAAGAPVARRLAGHQHQHRWSHVVYQDAGHLIAAPPYDLDRPESSPRASPRHHERRAGQFRRGPVLCPSGVMSGAHSAGSL
jgi:dienelactone hydrolase